MVRSGCVRVCIECIVANVCVCVDGLTEVCDDFSLWSDMWAYRTDCVCGCIEIRIIGWVYAMMYGSGVLMFLLWHACAH